MIIDLIYHLCNQVFDEYEYHPSHELSPLTINCTEKKRKKEKEIIPLGLKKKIWDLKHYRMNGQSLLFQSAEVRAQL